MARRPVLGGGSLSPFGSTGIDFGSFDLSQSNSNAAYLAFLRVETEWNAGRATNDQYLTALQSYANAQTPGTSDAVSITARYEQAKYTVGRNVLLDRVDARTASVADLVAYDKQALVGLNPDSVEYEQRLNSYQSSQSKLVADEEEKQVKLYQDGRLTTAQLRQWYKDVLTGSVIDRNADLADSISKRVDELTSRAQDEKDNQTLSNFQNGKMTTTDFVAYATAAKSRYAAGTTQAKEWDQRLVAARQQASETALLYRYNLSQQYADLERFVKGNAGGSAGGSAGGTRTSTSKRVILGTDGQWHTVTSTKTTKTPGHGPTANQQAAYKKLQIEITDAKRQMASIAAKIGGVGGFVSSTSVLAYYKKQLGTFAKGSTEWYQVQGKIDGLNSTIHHEQVYAKEGIRITYPSSGGGGSSAGGGSASATSSAHPSASSGGGGGGAKVTPAAKGGGGGYTLNQFMRAIATQESGGRYTARNKSSGAYGKYQILPSNWSSWAQKAGLSANAPQTPENQEKVATAAFARLAKSYNNDWSRVAAAWFAGVSGSANPAAWGPRTKAYVNAIMSHMGTTVAAVSGATAKSTVGSSAAGGGRVAAGGPSAAHPAAHVSTGKGPISIVTGVSIHKDPHHPYEVVTTHSQGFPTGLDSRSFEKFYANYERAFENGEESFVDSSSGKAIAYFVGDDPAERIDRMRHLDDLRVSMYDERARAYVGTASEITAANQRNNAYKDVARHEYEIIDTAAKTTGTKPTNVKTNPLASGVRLLDKTAAAVKQNIDMANAAYKRGDVTGAYSLYQEALQLLDGNGATIQSIADYAAATQAKISSLQRATGGVGPGEALGSEKGGTFQKDLDRLSAFDTELTKLFDPDSQKNLTELKSHLKTVDGSPNGAPVWDDPDSPNAQLVLSDDSYYELQGDGSVKLKSQPPTWDASTQQSKYGHPGKTVTVRVKAGTHVIDAEAPWVQGQVGAFIDPTDPNHLMPIMGKIVQQKTPNGWVTFYENPLSPGSSAGWSDKPWVFKAPTGFQNVVDKNGNVSYKFTAGGNLVGGRGATSTNGDTFAFVFDINTGTYVITRSNPGGLFQAAVDSEPWGVAGDSSSAALFASAGIVRQGGSAGGFDGTDIPVFGMTPDEYGKWLKSNQPPSLATYGQISKDALIAGGDPSSIKARAYMPPYQIPSDAVSAGDPSSIKARAYAPPFQLPADAIAAGDPSSIKARSGTTRTGLPPIAPPQMGGRSPDERDEAAKRAQLPPAPSPTFIASQKAATVKPVPTKVSAGKAKDDIARIPPAAKPKPTSSPKKATTRAPLKPIAKPTQVARGTKRIAS